MAKTRFSPLLFLRTIDGFQSRDEKAMLVHKTMANWLIFCIIIESNSQKNLFSFVLCTNMEAVKSGENHP